MHAARIDCSTTGHASQSGNGSVRATAASIPLGSVLASLQPAATRTFNLVSVPLREKEQDRLMHTACSGPCRLLKSARAGARQGETGRTSAVRMLQVSILSQVWPPYRADLLMLEQPAGPGFSLRLPRSTRCPSALVLLQQALQILKQVVRLDIQQLHCDDTRCAVLLLEGFEHRPG